MPSRIISTAMATAAATTGLVALTVGPAFAAGISPANTAVTATSTNVKFAGSLSGLNFSVTCATSTVKFVTPASGYGPVNLSAGSPSFTGCKDNFGGTATITVSGTWTLSATSTPTVTLTIPTAGAKFTTTTLPSCVVTAAPSGPAPITGPYNNSTHTLSVSGASVPFSGSGCGSISPTGTVSGDFVTNPAVSIT